jgi:glucosamine--fructose-6-phosphate aminotransferase (isomerizing)
LSKEEIRNIRRIIITACGTSWHAGLIGEYIIEEFTRIPVEVEYAAEFRYRNPIIDKETLLIAISQSGETADTIGALKEVQRLPERGKIVSICNVVGSSLARLSEGVVYTRAGPEIGVASTKAFTTQLAVLYLLALLLGRVREVISLKKAEEMIADLRQIPQKLEAILFSNKVIQEIAEKFYQRQNALYLGRGEGFPLALEGALKLKEVSYIHAEGYPAAEMKHGPIALIDENMPVIVLAFRGRRYEKILGNIEEVKARKGIVIAVTSEGDEEIKKKVDYFIPIPQTSERLSSILAVLPLQLLAYYIALKRGCNVDQPRNLAKSVTVE